MPVLFLFACASELPVGESGGLFRQDPLSVDAVSNIPEGDAQGSAFEGHYDAEIYTELCED